MSRVLLQAGAVAYQFEGVVKKVGLFSISAEGNPGYQDRQIPFSDISGLQLGSLTRKEIRPGDHIRGIYSKPSDVKPYYMGENDSFVVYKP